MPELLTSKKFQTALLTGVVAWCGHYFQLPEDVVQEFLMGLYITIGGFTVQDYARARDGASRAQLGTVVPAVLAKLVERGHIQPAVAETVTRAIHEMKAKDVDTLPRAQS